MIFRALDSLVSFPPKSVQLKKPFAVQPWVNSEENIGNFLMVRPSFFLVYEILEVHYICNLYIVVPLKLLSLVWSYACYFNRFSFANICFASDSDD